LNPIQTILLESDIPSTSSQPETTNEPRDESVIENLSDHYKGELSGYVANSEKASEIAFDEVILEIPQQQQLELRPDSPNIVQKNLNLVMLYLILPI